MKIDSIISIILKIYDQIDFDITKIYIKTAKIINKHIKNQVCS